MQQRRVGIIMNGVTGRMGLNQHLVRSVLAIRKQGGVKLADGSVLMPDPILLGRNEQKLKAIADAHGLTRWSTDLPRALENKEDTIYFDAGSTGIREGNVMAAIAAGKHVYCEKPLSTTMESSIRLAVAAEKAGIKHGVVQDKLFLPGIRKLRRLIDGRFCRCAASLATGCLRATGRRRSGPRGTTRRKRTAGSFWTCSATGGMCWTIRLGRWRR